MAQELSDKIRAAAQAKGIDPEIALRIARAESAVNPAAQAKTSSAGGLFQVVDKTWKEFGGKPGKKYDPDENIRVGTDIIAKNTQTLKSFLNRDPRPAEVYAAHYFGPSGAKSFLSAEPATPIVDILGKQAVKANPNLQGKNVGQVMAQLEKKMGSAPAPAASVSRETPAPARQPLPPSLPPMAATEESSAPPSRMASLGPSYQAALALSFLADTDDKEDRDIDREPGVAEKWLAEQAPRPAALAQFADLSIKSPFAAMEPQQPVQMFNKGGEVEPLTPEELEAASRPATVNPNIRRQGEAARRLAAMRDVNTLPDPRTYAAVSGFLGQAPDELGFSVMHPDAEGIKKAGQAGFGVGTALQVAPVVGQAAKMLAKMTGSAINERMLSGQSLTPGFNTPAPINFAIRPRGTPFMMERGPISSVGDFQPVDQAENYVRQTLATSPDAKLNDWFSTRMLNYLRRDFASPEDQFVKAAEEGKLLHMAKKPTKRDQEDVLDFSRREGLKYTRETEGFPPQGLATTPYGQRIESLTDVSVNPATLEDLMPYQVPPSMKARVETDPSARVSDLATYPEETLQLRSLRDDMLRMRQLGPEYSAYGQAPVKVPKEYLLTDESLIGLTPAQASNRVATFRNWEQDVKEKMASKFMNDDPNIDRQDLAGGYKAAMLPDLADAPAYKQLAMDVGCDGGWCTRSEQTALDYGSGENRLHMIMDNRARPMAQLTLSQINPTSMQLAKDPGAKVRFSVTELKGKGNSTDFENNPALPAIQQHIRNLDRQYDLRYVADLKSLGMKELDPGDLVTGAGKLSTLRNRFRPGITAEEYEAAARPDLADLQAAIRELNDGSKYVTKDRDTKALVEEALKLLAPQQRATGGMIERQSTDNRRYL